jgi:hypothetical protein
VNETAGMLDARLGVIERIRRIEHLLARSEQARIAATLMKGFSHELGNQVQIVKLAAFELARRVAKFDGNHPVNGVSVGGAGGSAVAVDGYAATQLGLTHAPAGSLPLGLASELDRSGRRGVAARSPQTDASSGTVSAAARSPQTDGSSGTVAARS